MSKYACPICCKSVCDMSKVWEKLDIVIAATPMPESYHNLMVSISSVYFMKWNHHLGFKHRQLEIDLSKIFFFSSFTSKIDPNGLNLFNKLVH